MPTTIIKKILILSLFLITSQVLLAQDENETIQLIPEAKSFVTKHEIINGGKSIKYKAVAAETYLKNEAGEEVAALWSVAYVQEGINDQTKRPVTFVFNGGPGSSSVWLHMGMFGPQLVKLDSDAKVDDGAAPYKMVANNKGLFDLTDFVFVDPVGTGYSRVIGKGKKEDFWGLYEDAESISNFMRQWITDNNRWFSPKYIVGESYGTPRAVAVTEALEGGGQNMALNGLILISQCLDYAGSTSLPDNITSYLTYLPSMAATSWYHKKAGQGQTLEAFVEECRNYTYDAYAPALYRGSYLSDSEKDKVAEKLSYFTGLKKDYILKSNLRIMMQRYQKELLSDQGIVIGRNDGRFMGSEIDQLSDGPHLGDASNYQTSSAYTAAMNYYNASVLQVKMDRPYITSNGSINSNWNWRPIPLGQDWEPSFMNVARTLGETMRRNTAMKVLVTAGYYDLICPFFDAEYTFSRNGIEKEKVKIAYYEAGHMMYLHEPDYLKMSEDLRVFFSE